MVLNVSSRCFLFIILSILQLCNFNQITNASMKTWVGLNRKFYMYANSPKKYVFLNGTGTIFLTDNDSLRTLFQRVSKNVGEVYIKDLNSCRYICLNNHKKARAMKTASKACIFRETLAENSYNIYESKLYPNTYLSANKIRVNTEVNQLKKALFLPVYNTDIAGTNVTHSKNCREKAKKLKNKRKKTKSKSKLKLNVSET